MFGHLVGVSFSVPQISFALYQENKTGNTELLDIICGVPQGSWTIAFPYLY